VVRPSLPALATTIELVVIGGLWEEIGWPGHALPRLQRPMSRRSDGPLRAALIVGVVGAAWHLPLILYGKLFWFDLVLFEISFQLIIAWLYNVSGGSVPAVMAFHLTSNAVEAILSPVFAGPDRMAYYLLCMGLASVVAVSIAWRSRRRAVQVAAA